MGKHRVIPCTPPADPDALLIDDTAREHIDTLRDVTTEIARSRWWTAARRPIAQQPRSAGAAPPSRT